MVKLRIAVVTVFFIGIMYSLVFSAPVDLPMSLKGIEPGSNPYGTASWESNVSLALEVDTIIEKELDKFEAEGTSVNLKLVYSATDRIDVYGILGQAMNTEYDGIISDASVNFDLENKIFWGFGINMVIYQWEDQNLSLFGDFKYKNIDDRDYDGVTVNGTRYVGSQLTNKVDAEWEELQIALGVSKKLEYATPYIGILFADVDAAAQVTAGGTTYDASNSGADNELGLFVGCVFVPAEHFSFELEGHVLSEESIAAKAAYRF